MDWKAIRSRAYTALHQKFGFGYLADYVRKAEKELGMPPGKGEPTLARLILLTDRILKGGAEVPAAAPPAVVVEETPPLMTVVFPPEENPTPKEVEVEAPAEASVVIEETPPQEVSTPEVAGEVTEEVTTVLVQQPEENQTLPKGKRSSKKLVNRYPIQSRDQREHGLKEDG